MTYLRRIVSAIVLAVVSIAGSQAWAVDYYNSLAAGWDDPGDGTRIVLVRMPNGTLHKKVFTTPGSAWQPMNSPGGGLASNPVGAAFGNPTQNFFVGTDQGTVKLSTNGGTTWSTTFGAPSSIAASSVAIAGIPGGEGNLALISANGIPWTRRRLSNGTLLPWTQVGNVAMSAAPGIAMTTFRVDIFGLKQNGQIVMTTNQYPTVFSETSQWSEVPPSGARANTQPNAVWIDGTATDGPWLAVAFTGLDNNAYVSTYNNATATWSALEWRGGVFTSAVAITKPVSGTTPILVGRGTNAEFYVSTSGTAWSSIGHP